MPSTTVGRGTWAHECIHTVTWLRPTLTYLYGIFQVRHAQRSMSVQHNILVDYSSKILHWPASVSPCMRMGPRTTAPFEGLGIWLADP